MDLPAVRTKFRRDIGTTAQRDSEQRWSSNLEIDFVSKLIETLKYPLESRGNYSATSNNIKLVHWPLICGLLHLVQWGGTGWCPSPPRPLLAVPNVTAHTSTASVRITVLLYNGPLLCDFNVGISGLTGARHNYRGLKSNQSRMFWCLQCSFDAEMCSLNLQNYSERVPTNMGFCASFNPGTTLWNDLNCISLS